MAKNRVMTFAAEEQWYPVGDYDWTNKAGDKSIELVREPDDAQFWAIMIAEDGETCLVGFAHQWKDAAQCFLRINEIICSACMHQETVGHVCGI